MPWKTPAAGADPHNQRQNLTLAEAAIDSAVNAIVIIDHHGVMLRVNPATESLFGFASADLVGRNISVLMPEPYRSAHDRYIAAYMGTGKKKIIGIGREVVGLKRDGTTFPMHLSVGEFQTDGGSFFVGGIHDLTARKTAEAESRRQTTLFQAIFDNVPDPIIISNAERRIMLCNPAVSEVFGYAPEQLIGQEIRLLCSTEDEYVRFGSLRRSMRRAEPPVVEFRKRDGKTFPGASESTKIIASDGRDLGWLTIIRDISRRLQQETALRKAQRMEALGQLTGGIAHDFNNLLTIITGNNELLEMMLDDPEQLDLLKRANDAAMMGARLTARLLKFARRRPLEAVLINLNEQVIGMMDLLRRTIGETITLSSSLSPKLWQVKSDPSEIENAVLNLAINARDAMPGGGRLLIETRNVVLDDDDVILDNALSPGGYVRLSVSDSGTGMTPDVLARVFEPFFTTKEGGRGTGLGLSTVYGFARQSGGHVNIYSEVGKGTSVHLYLPRSSEDAKAAGPSDEHEVTRSLAGVRVLVVEDQAPVRDVTVRRLAGLGCNVVEAENGGRAIDILSAGETFDVVFSDVVMPGMTGLELRTWVQEHQPGTAVLLTSGFAGDVLGTEREHGSEAMLRKPYSREDLARAIAQAVWPGR